ncbi:MAG: hypothetical protein SGI86_14095 [Deltaproteobacteria bacterium]|nr:hypothetical protein [Deltaproteobacteria bacterium]
MNLSSCRVSFVGMDALEPARAEVMAWLPRLGSALDRATGVHVFIEAISQKRKEQLLRVRIDFSFPDGILEILHDDPKNAAHDDVFVAIRNAFRAARLQLELFKIQPDALPPPVARQLPV